MKTMRSTDGKRIWRATDERASVLYRYFKYDQVTLHKHEKP